MFLLIFFIFCWIRILTIVPDPGKRSGSTTLLERDHSFRSEYSCTFCINVGEVPGSMPALTGVKLRCEQKRLYEKRAPYLRWLIIRVPNWSKLFKFQSRLYVLGRDIKKPFRLVHSQNISIDL